jgi:hypothetical protein
MTRQPAGAAAVAAAAVLLLLAGCGGDARPTTPAGEAASASARASDAASTATDHGHAAKGDGADDRAPLRRGERFARLAMPAAYTPSAPHGAGNDDYRCFLLDPHLGQNAFLTGLDVLPGTKRVVHHVILFKVPPDAVAQAKAQDAGEKGQGWTCFGGTGIGDGGNGLDDVPWLGAWAPGGGERVMADDLGIPLEAGTRVVMQVHYNLLAGPGPDVTSARLRLAPGDADLEPLQTVLLPAPVELPCRPGRTGELCSRDHAVADVMARFGPSGQTANALHLLCGTRPPGPVQRCDRTIERPATLRAVAGHMHLLGRSLHIDVNPGTPRERRVLDIPVWDFDDQGSQPVDPMRLRPGDVVRVTCEHDQALRDVLPAFEGQEERYVVWGEGTTDEMCLGMLLVTRP